jgi:hypothetical protein
MAVATELSVSPLAYAMAFTVVVPLMVNGAV